VGFEFYEGDLLPQEIECKIPIRELALALECPPRLANDIGWMSMELLRRHYNAVRGNADVKQVPIFETGIQRYFRENPEAI
jgi:hypothetical protein